MVSELISYVLITLVILATGVSSVTIHCDGSVYYASALVGVQIDAIAKLIRVIDGDTVNAVIVNVSVTFSNYLHVGEDISIRFADIDAPELYVNGERNEPGWRSRSVLIDLLNGRDTLYLDIDNEEIFDHYGRLIAVVYVSVNETHLLNVNKWMVDNHYARIWDFRNATYPDRWVLYVNTSNVQFLTGGVESSTSKELLGNRYLTPIVLYLVISVLIITGYLAYSKYLSKTQSKPSFEFA